MQRVQVEGDGMKLTAAQTETINQFGLRPGHVFNTPVEIGCVVDGPVDECGLFEAVDLNGDVSQFHVSGVCGLAHLLVKEVKQDDDV